MSVDKLPTVAYAAAMTAPLAAVATDAGALGLRPRYLQVSINAYHELEHGRPWQVSVQTEDVADADRLADHYGLDPDDHDGPNYTRIGVAVLPGIGNVLVRVYTGRPKDRTTRVREFIAANYSDESKRRVEYGEEALPEDYAKFAAALAAGLFDEVAR